MRPLRRMAPCGLDQPNHFLAITICSPSAARPEHFRPWPGRDRPGHRIGNLAEPKGLFDERIVVYLRVRSAGLCVAGDIERTRTRQCRARAPHGLDPV